MTAYYSNHIVIHPILILAVDLLNLVLKSVCYICRCFIRPLNKWKDIGLDSQHQVLEFAQDVFVGISRIHMVTVCIPS